MSVAPVAAFVPSTITTYGAIHTAISMIPVFLGLYLYLARGTIRFESHLGKIYWFTNIIGTVTGLTIFHHGGPGAPHAVSVLMLVLLMAAAVPKFAGFGRLTARTVEIIAFSTTYFFLWFFVSTETLTRLPVNKPFSPSPEDLALAPIRGVLVLLLVVGIWWQLRREKTSATAT